MQLGAQSLGLSLDQQLTRTGGLPFAGGPWNNYVMHAIATVMRELRDGVGTVLAGIGDLERLIAKICTNRATPREVVALRSMLEAVSAL